MSLYIFFNMGRIQANAHRVIDAVFEKALVPLQANRERLAETSRAPLGRETLGDTDLALIAKRVKGPMG